MLTDAFLYFVSALYWVVCLLLPDVNYGDTSLLGELTANAHAWIVLFPPFKTLIQMVLVLIGVQVGIWLLKQALNLFNWVRGTGGLNFHG